MIIQIRDHFKFGPGWYRGDGVRDLVLQYYFALRFVLKTKPCLRRCLTRCRHCHIFFLTHPCNAGRKDLGCPFGCQEGHGKRCSTNRSVEYYRTPEGKLKKRIQNKKRGMGEAKAVINDCGQCRSNLVLLPYRLGGPMMGYLRMVISLIEGRRVSAAEILEMLARVLRQRSLVGRRRIDYILQYLNGRAP
ncbi:MAG: hypothetical protein ABSF52_24355 [Syntrophobacteraceae bacterium]